jgi:glycosyltransferase involved in cell wall biosynthesis
VRAGSAVRFHGGAVKTRGKHPLRILINDFIGGVLDRGIPLYVRNLVEGLRAEGFDVSVVRAPALCRLLPRNVFYALAIVVEQIALPVIGLLRRADLTLYPYNSVAMVDLLTRRGRIVVHDLEPLNRPMSFSKAYYLFCYRALKWCNGPIFTISELTRQRLVKSDLFGTGPVIILPNTFYAFEELIAAQAPNGNTGDSILLCTGSTANKDLETVVVDHLPRVLAKGFRVAIVGLHKATDAPRLSALEAFIASGQLRVCGRLSDEEVARAYQSHTLVWVHSLREGFGRCVVEGRLAGRRVICTDIPEFAGLRDDGVFLYKDAAEFAALVDRLMPMAPPAGRYQGYPYRDLLRRAIYQFADRRDAVAGIAAQGGGSTGNGPGARG